MKEFWIQIKESLWNFVNNYGKVIAAALVVLSIGVLLISIMKKAVKKSSTKSRRIDNSAASFVTAILSLVAYVVLFIIMVAALGFSTEGIIAGLSSVMLAVALGLQNTLASLANGILLIFTKPFKAGDFVDIGGTSGTVKEVKLFSVKIVTTDNLTVIIPNNTVFGSVIINYSKMPLRRLDMVIPVGYDTDVEALKTLMQQLICEDERILSDPAPFFRLTEYGSSSLNFTLRVWTSVSDFWSVKFDLLEKIVAVFRENNVEIPYNQLGVRLIENKEDKA